MSNDAIGQRSPGTPAYVVAYAALCGLVWFATLSVVLVVIGV